MSTFPNQNLQMGFFPRELTCVIVKLGSQSHNGKSKTLDLYTLINETYQSIVVFRPLYYFAKYSNVFFSSCCIQLKSRLNFFNAWNKLKPFYIVNSLALKISVHKVQLKYNFWNHVVSMFLTLFIILHKHFLHNIVVLLDKITIFRARKSIKFILFNTICVVLKLFNLEFFL